MAGRVLAFCSVIAILTFAVGCGSQTNQLASIAVTPTTAVIPNTGGTAQFQATGTFMNGKNKSQTYQNLTDQVVWTSSVATVATIDSTGLATATGAGTTTITATGGNGGVNGTATLTVSSSSTGNLTSITVLPANLINVPGGGQTVQYVAIGTFTGSKPVQDVTQQVSWSSSNMSVASISATGLATTAGACVQGAATTITASLSNLTGNATLTYGSCGLMTLPTLTIYGPGEGAGTITSTPPGLDCNTSTGTGCSSTAFPLNSQVTLTATPASGSVFAGWSANCQPANSTTCNVMMDNYTAVAAIFNPASQ
jgi:hypothetical protein